MVLRLFFQCLAVWLASTNIIHLNALPIDTSKSPDVKSQSILIGDKSSQEDVSRTGELLTSPKEEFVENKKDGIGYIENNSNKAEIEELSIDAQNEMGEKKDKIDNGLPSSDLTDGGTSEELKKDTDIDDSAVDESTSVDDTQSTGTKKEQVPTDEDASDDSDDANAETESDDMSEKKSTTPVSRAAAVVKAQTATKSPSPKAKSSKRHFGEGHHEHDHDDHGHHDEHEHHEHEHGHHDHGYEFYEEWGEHEGHEGHHHGDEHGESEGHEEGGHGGGGYGGFGGGFGGHGGEGHGHEHGHEHEHHEHDHEHGHHGHHAGYHHEWGHHEGGEHEGHEHEHDHGHEHDHEHEHGDEHGGYGGGGYKSQIATAKNNEQKTTAATEKDKAAPWQRWGDYWLWYKNQNKSEKQGKEQRVEKTTTQAAAKKDGQMGEKKWWMVGDHWGGWGHDHWGAPHHVEHGEGGWQYGHTGFHGGHGGGHHGGYGGGGHHGGYGGYGGGGGGGGHHGGYGGMGGHHEGGFGGEGHHEGGYGGYGGEGHHEEGGYGGGGHHGGYGGMGGHHEGGFGGGHHGGFGGGHHGGFGGGGGGGYGGGGHHGGGHHGGYGGYGGGGHHKSDIPGTEEEASEDEDSEKRECCGHHQTTNHHGGYHFVDHGDHDAHHEDYDHDHHLQGPWSFGYDHWGDDWSDWDHNHHNFEHLQSMGHHGGHGYHKSSVPLSGGDDDDTQKGSKRFYPVPLRAMPDVSNPIVAPVGFGGYGAVAPGGHYGLVPVAFPGRLPGRYSLDCYPFFKSDVPGKDGSARRCGINGLGDGIHVGYGSVGIANHYPLGGWYGWGGWPWGAYGDFVGNGNVARVCGPRPHHNRVVHVHHSPCIGFIKAGIPNPSDDDNAEEGKGGKSRQNVVYPYIGYGPWAAYPWWGDWWGGHGHHGWGTHHGGHGGGHGGHGVGHGGGHGGGGHGGGIGWHCRDVIPEAKKSGKDKKASTRFCVPIGYYGGYGWPYWHGYPGVGTGLYGWGWPWYKSKVPKGKKGEEKAEEKSESKDAAASATTRSDIPHTVNEKASKKQTIHVGYGYASGDNYRLGYGFGGMGGVSGFSGGNGFEAGAGGSHGISRSSIAKKYVTRTKNAVIPTPQLMKEETGTKREIESGTRQLTRRSGPAGERHDNFPGYGFATPYGHPVTHPGFTTIGFPGHALTSPDIKNKIPHTPANKGKAKRQVFSPTDGYTSIFPFPENAMVAPGPVRDVAYPEAHVTQGIPGIMGANAIATEENAEAREMTHVHKERRQADETEATNDSEDAQETGDKKSSVADQPEAVNKEAAPDKKEESTGEKKASVPNVFDNVEKTEGDVSDSDEDESAAKREFGEGHHEGHHDDHGHHDEHEHHDHGHHHHDHGYEFYEEWDEHQQHGGHHHGDEHGEQEGHGEGGHGGGFGGGFGGGGGGGGGEGGHGHEHGHEHEHEEHEHEHEHHGHHAGYHHEWGHHEGGEHEGHEDMHHHGHEHDHEHEHEHGHGHGGHGGGGFGGGGFGWGGGGGGGGYKSKITKAQEKGSKPKVTTRAQTASPKVKDKPVAKAKPAATAVSANASSRPVSETVTRNDSSKVQKWWKVGDGPVHWGTDRWGGSDTGGHHGYRRSETKKASPPSSGANASPADKEKEDSDA